jgi:hypothetical protein
MIYKQIIDENQVSDALLGAQPKYSATPQCQ